MKGFKILEHTSELKIRAFGGTREELFLNMMSGMFAVLAPQTCKSQITNHKFQTNSKFQILNSKQASGVKRKIEIKSQDINALLVDFLNECLYLSQINHEIYQNVKLKRFTETSHQNKYGARQAELAGVLIGKKVERFAEDIKAVTHHGVEVKKNEEGLWQVDVIYDI